MKGIALLVCTLAVLAVPGGAPAQTPPATAPAVAAPQEPAQDAPEEGGGVDPTKVTCGDLAALLADNEAQAAEFALDLLDVFFEENGITVTEEAIDRGFAAIDRGCPADPAATVWRVLQAAL